MTRSKETIEQGLAAYRRLAEESPEVRDEMTRTRGWFDASGDSGTSAEAEAALLLALRRHLEWFLLERPSEHLGGVPVEALLEPWLEQQDEGADPGLFLNSRAGAFEVTGIDRGQGLWIRDLFGLGEYPVAEPEAAAEIEEGDLLVGRIFPVGEETFRLSPAMACIRNAALREAIRSDTDAMRAARRGILRVEQVELERLFFGGTGRPPAGAAETLEPSPERTLRELLAGAGIEAERIEEILLRATASVDGNGGLTEILNELAFETTVDLEPVREALAAFWKGGSTPSVPAGVELSEPVELPEPVVSPDPNDVPEPIDLPAPREPQPEEEPAPPVEPQTVARALDAFNEGRANGADLDSLFRQLAADLGFEDAVGEERGGMDVLESMGNATLPDFSGAVGAMVEEFFWEFTHTAPPDAAPVEPPGRRTLPLLAQYGTRIGVFENLSAHDILDFAGRWVLQEHRLASAEDAEDLLSGLRRFTRWCDEKQALGIVAEATPILDELTPDLPRLAEASRFLVDDPPTASAPYEVASVGDRAAELRDDKDRLVPVTIDSSLLAYLRPGDLVRAVVDGDLARVTACYPSALKRLRG